MNPNQKIEIPDTKYHKMVKWICIILQAGTLLYLLLVWNRLPEKIPTHYNGVGEIDGYGSRFTIWLTPVIMILTYLLISFLEQHPDYWNTGVNVTRKNAERVYSVLKNMIVTLKLVLVLTFGYMSVWTTTGTGLGKWFLPVSLALTFGPVVWFGILLVRASKDS